MLRTGRFKTVCVGADISQVDNTHGDPWTTPQQPPAPQQPTGPPVVGNRWAPPTDPWAAPAAHPGAVVPLLGPRPRPVPVLTGTVVALVVLGLLVGGYALLRGEDTYPYPPAGASSDAAAGPGAAADSPPAGPVETGPLDADEPGPPPGRVVVTPADAADVVARYWPAHEKALADGDLRALADLSSGSAHFWEAGAVACGCVALSGTRPLNDATYFVPRQRSYPAYFVAEVATEFYAGGEPAVELLVFQRQHRRAAWRVVQDSFFRPLSGGPVTLGTPDTTPDGFTRPVSRERRQRARAVARRAAALWQEAKDTGRVPDGSGFDLVGQAAERVQRLAAHRQDEVQNNGLLGHFVYRTSREDPLVVVPQDGGVDLACQPIRATIVYTPRRGQVVYQDPELANFGTQVPAGTYSSMTLHQSWQTCFFIRQDEAAPVTILDQGTGGGSAIGVR